MFASRFCHFKCKFFSFFAKSNNGRVKRGFEKAQKNHRRENSCGDFSDSERFLQLQIQPLWVKMCGGQIGDDQTAGIRALRKIAADQLLGIRQLACRLLPAQVGSFRQDIQPGDFFLLPEDFQKNTGFYFFAFLLGNQTDGKGEGRQQPQRLSMQKNPGRSLFESQLSARRVKGLPQDQAPVQLPLIGANLSPAFFPDLPIMGRCMVPSIQQTVQDCQQAKAQAVPKEF